MPLNGTAVLRADIVARRPKVARSAYDRFWPLANHQIDNREGFPGTDRTAPPDRAHAEPNPWKPAQFFECPNALNGLRASRPSADRTGQPHNMPTMLKFMRDVGDVASRPILFE